MHFVGLRSLDLRFGERVAESARPLGPAADRRIGVRQDVEVVEEAAEAEDALDRLAGGPEQRADLDGGRGGRLRALELVGRRRRRRREDHRGGRGERV